MNKRSVSLRRTRRGNGAAQRIEREEDGGRGVARSPPGNNRLDSLTNMLANPVVGLLFIVPGFNNTMRVNGRATIIRDPDLLAMLAVKDRPPTVAIVVAIDEVFIQCAKAFRRSRLWDPSQIQDRSEMPSLNRIILDQNSEAPDESREIKEISADLKDAYKMTMY